MQKNSLLHHIRKLTLFAIPVSASMLVNMISSFAAMFMVAKLGKEELAAGALALSTYITVAMVSCIFYAVGILTSHMRAEGKPAAEIGALVKAGLWLGFVLAIPTALLLWNVNYVLLFLGQDPQLVKLTVGYFHFAAFLIFPMLLGMVMGQFYTGMGHPKFNLYISIVILPIIILLSYGLILGKLGLPKLGLAGVSCANLIIFTVLFLAESAYLLVASQVSHFKVFTGTFLPHREFCKKILNLGFPIGVQFGGELAAMAAATYFMGYFGVIPLAAGQVVSQYAMLVVMIFLGLSQALSVLVSEAYVQKDHALILQYIKSSLIILTVFFVFVFLVFIFASEYLIDFFVSKKDIHDPALVHLAMIFFVIAGFTLYFDGMRNLFSSALRGLHDSKAPMIIGVVCIWLISVPASYIAGFVLHFGPVGLRIGFMIGFIVPVLWLWQRIKKKIYLMDKARG